VREERSAVVSREDSQRLVEPTELAHIASNFVARPCVTTDQLELGVCTDQKDGPPSDVAGRPLDDASSSRGDHRGFLSDGRQVQIVLVSEGRDPVVLWS
jgi:hypothetical protein